MRNKLLPANQCASFGLSYLFQICFSVSDLFQICFRTVSELFQTCFRTVSVSFLFHFCFLSVSFLFHFYFISVVRVPFHTPRDVVRQKSHCSTSASVPAEKLKSRWLTAKRRLISHKKLSMVNISDTGCGSFGCGTGLQFGFVLRFVLRMLHECTNG